MKLRIRGNSVRLRVSKSELAQLAESGYTEDAVSFAPGSQLRYRLDVAPEGSVGAAFEPSLLRVVVPRRDVSAWLDPAAVSIRAEQAIGDGNVLKILVEKDFECLAPREDEDGTDLFDNPRRPGS
jgi:hypothetical protein